VNVTVSPDRRSSAVAAHPQVNTAASAKVRNAAAARGDAAGGARTLRDATAAEKRGAGPDIKTLHAKIGQLALENDFLAGALGRIGDASAKR